MSFARIARTFALPVLVLAVALSAGADDWDQQRAIELSSQLEETFDLVVQSAEIAAPQQTAMQQRTRDAALSEFTHVRDISRDYAAKIREGWGREDSEPFFSQLSQATRRAREIARDAVPVPKVAVLLERVDSLLLQLSKQYESA
jgi:hypothetical protein